MAARDGSLNPAVEGALRSASAGSPGPGAERLARRRRGVRVRRRRWPGRVPFEREETAG
jgi:hypothetical protein